MQVWIFHSIFRHIFVFNKKWSQSICSIAGCFRFSGKCTSLRINSFLISGQRLIFPGSSLCQLALPRSWMKSSSSEKQVHPRIGLTRNSFWLVARFLSFTYSYRLFANCRSATSKNPGVSKTFVDFEVVKYGAWRLRSIYRHFPMSLSPLATTLRPE